ncbi:MAG: radical SAM protein, partial [Chloroflexota bacterium]
HWHNEKIVCNPRVDIDLQYLPVPRRRIFNNKKYEQFGAIVGLETKRGCSQKCIYCADPVAKGTRMRLRPPEMVVKELQDLLEQGVSWLHLCDSEFNLPIKHAKEICQAIIDKGLGDKIRWYCYCAPTPFDSELARLMKGAGCAGINFGVDSLCDDQLHRLGRLHSSNDVHQLVRLLHNEGLNYMFDLLIGSPEETEDTVRITIDKAREFNIPLVGIAVGVRLYPNTVLGNAVTDGIIKAGLHPDINKDLDQPVFYLSPSLNNASTLINQLVGNDPRFLMLSAPAEKGSYNYAGDEVLSNLIKQGARGAYWDIIRQHRN